MRLPRPDKSGLAMTKRGLLAMTERDRFPLPVFTSISFMGMTPVK